VAPQLVACGERDFYRITPNALEAFEIAAELPPPNIRGSRVAQKVVEVPVGEALNVFSPARKSALVIAKGGVFRYGFGDEQARRYAPIPAAAPLVAWPDAGRADSFRVRTVGDEKLRTYTLAGAASGDAGSPPAPAQVARRVEDLPAFDGRLLTLLADGTPLYSTGKGLTRRGRGSRPLPLPEPPGPPTLLFADSSPERYWTADASGRLALWDSKHGASPVLTASVPGVVIDAALEGERVAVISVALDGHSYRPAVTIFVNGKEQARLSVGTSVVARKQPPLDLCLIHGRPWVVVGGTRWVQLLDWESRRLLAEW
jgi:hypothetical protein